MSRSFSAIGSFYLSGWSIILVGAVEKRFLFALRLFIAAIIWIFLIAIVVFLFFFFQQLLHRNDWKERTIPLTAEVQADICKKFSVNNANLCDPEKIVYGPDLWPSIYRYYGIERYTSEPTRPLYKSEIDILLGDYFTHCEDLVTTGDGFSYYRCFYDLAGDGEIPIFALYNSDFSVIRLMNSTDP